MPKINKVKQIGKSYSLMGMVDTKYCCYIPSIATIHKGQLWPIGISIKWLWFGVSFVNVDR